MRVRMESNVPDARVIVAIVLLAAAAVLAISALRLGTSETRGGNPVDAPTVPAGATTAPVPATLAPATSPLIIEATPLPAQPSMGGSPVRTVGPLVSPVPEASNPTKPDLPPPGYHD